MFLYQLRQLRSIRRSLPLDAQRALVSAFISSRLDYCNAATPAGTIHRLQIVMLLDWLLTLAGTSTVHQFFACDILHWLPVQQRIIFKIAVLAFKCIRDNGPGYFNGVCTPLADIPGRSSLRAGGRGDLLVPSTKMKIGSRSFRIAAPTVWNSLPLHLRDRTISERLFRSALKTHLFQ